jgi:hypothetical protein
MVFFFPYEDKLRPYAISYLINKQSGIYEVSRFILQKNHVDCF